MKIYSPTRLPRNAIIIILFFFSNLCFSQLRGDENSHDTSIAQACYELSDRLYVIDLDTIVYFCKKSLEICETHLSARLSEEEKKSFLLTKYRSPNNFGYFYHKNGDLPLALDHYNRALLITEELGDSLGVANVFNNIAVLYKTQGETEASSNTYLKVLEICRKIGFKKGISIALNNIAGVYEVYIGDYEKAQGYFHESLAIREEMQDSYSIATSLNNLGYLYEVLRDTAIALDYYQKSLSIRRKLEAGIVVSLVNVGRIQLDQGYIDSALICGKEALNISQKIGLIESTRNAANLLMQVYRAQRLESKEYEMFRLYIALRDSFRNQENKVAVYKQQMQYNYQKQKALGQKEGEKLLAIVHKKREQQYLITAIVSVFLIIFFILSIVLFNKWKLTKKQKQIIESQNDSFSKKYLEKEYMVKEMHHRVKNNLQIVCSLLRFQANKFDDEDILQAFQASQNRILSMSLVHEQLYSTSENLMKVEADKHLSKLLTSIIEEYSISVKITLECKIEKNKLGLKTLIPLSLVINEIVSNSMKHAFEGMKSGTIIIQLSKIADKRYRLMIGDDGIGIASRLGLKKPSGLGMELIEVFTEQLDGELQKLDGQGTMYQITFNEQI